MIMTMKKKMILGAFVASLLVTSCASYQKTAPVLGVTNNGINTYVEADLDYDHVKKVEGVVETKTLFGIPLTHNGRKLLKSTNRYKGLDKRESQALYRAKESAGVDLILEPEFEKEKHSYFFGAYKSSYTKVKGWGVNIKGIKKDSHFKN